MALVGAVEGLADLGGTGGGVNPGGVGKGRLKLDVFLLSPEHEDEPCFFIRPGLNQFLTKLAHHYELVLYTAAMRDYANYFMDQIDQKGLFSHILCREHC